MEYHVEQVYKDGYGQYLTKAQVDRMRKSKEPVSVVIGGFAVISESGLIKRWNGLPEVYSKKYIAEQEAEHFTKLENMS